MQIFFSSQRRKTMKEAPKISKMSFLANGKMNLSISSSGGWIAKLRTQSQSHSLKTNLMWVKSLWYAIHLMSNCIFSQVNLDQKDNGEMKVEKKKKKEKTEHQIQWVFGVWDWVYVIIFFGFGYQAKRCEERKIEKHKTEPQREEYDGIWGALRCGVPPLGWMACLSYLYIFRSIVLWGSCHGTSSIDSQTTQSWGTR